MSELETRTTPAQVCELRAIQGAEGTPPRIAGYAAVFNVRSEVLGGMFVEEIAPGAFDDVVGQDVRGLFNHNPDFLLGRTKSGTLRLVVDERGLAYEIDPPDTQTVRDQVLVPLSRGDMDGSSFGFRVALDGDTWREEGGLVIRTIHRIAELRDVGPVSFPAYPDATAAKRSMDAWKQAKEEGEAGQARLDREARERFLAYTQL